LDPDPDAPIQHYNPQVDEVARTAVYYAVVHQNPHHLLDEPLDGVHRHRLLPPPGQEDPVLVDHLLLPQHLPGQSREVEVGALYRLGDRKSTRLSSSHVSISYAVFCLKKKRTHQENKHNAK